MLVIYILIIVILVFAILYTVLYKSRQRQNILPREPKQDPWKIIDEIKWELRQAGENSWYKKINSVFENNIMAGEIVGEAVNLLRELRKSPAAKKLGLNEKIDKSLKILDSFWY